MTVAQLMQQKARHLARGMCGLCMKPKDKRLRLKLQSGTDPWLEEVDDPEDAGLCRDCWRRVGRVIRKEAAE